MPKVKPVPMMLKRSERPTSPSLRARQRAWKDAMRARVAVIVARTRAGRAYFDALIAGKPAVRPVMPSPSPSERALPLTSRKVAGAVTAAPYSAAMSSTRASSSAHQIQISDEAWTKLEAFAALVGRPVDDVADYIVASGLPPPPTKAAERTTKT